MSLSVLVLAALGSAANSGLYDPNAPVFTLAPSPLFQEEAAEEEKPQMAGFEWEGGLTAGLTILAGNNRSSSAYLSFGATGRGDDDRLTVGANYLTGRTENRDRGSPDFREKTTTARQVSANAKYDRFLNEEQTTYAYINGLILKDGVRDLDLLLNVGVGLGVQWFEKEEMQFLGLGKKAQSFFTEAGIGYTEENYEGSVRDEEYLSARVAFHYDAQLTETAFFFNDSYWIPSLEDIEQDQLVHSETGLRTKISENLNAEAKVIWDWDASPAPGRGRRDVAYIFGVNWTF